MITEYAKLALAAALEGKPSNIKSEQGLLTIKVDHLTIERDVNDCLRVTWSFEGRPMCWNVHGPVGKGDKLELRDLTAAQVELTIG